MNASVIRQPKLRLITAKSASFPDGNRAALQSLESHLKSLKGRKFYGLVYETENGMEYFAGLVPDNEIEERRFAEMGFSITEVEGGVRVPASSFSIGLRRLIGLARLWER